jgi:hypothetical protein
VDTKRPQMTSHLGFLCLGGIRLLFLVYRGYIQLYTPALRPGIALRAIKMTICSVFAAKTEQIDRICGKYRPFWMILRLIITPPYQ